MWSRCQPASPNHRWASSAFCICQRWSSRSRIPSAQLGQDEDGPLGAKVSMSNSSMNVARDQAGAVLVEVTIVMTIMLVFLLGSIEFLFVFYQWNAAAKAVQMGARIAAVSDPVAGGMNGLSTAVVGSLVLPGGAMPSFV